MKTIFSVIFSVVKGAVIFGSGIAAGVGLTYAFAVVFDGYSGVSIGYRIILAILFVLVVALQIAEDRVKRTKRGVTRIDGENGNSGMLH